MAATSEIAAGISGDHLDTENLENIDETDPAIPKKKETSTTKY